MSTTPVTFFFSDIQGSTRLLESVGQAYSGILNRHRSILRNAFAERQGAEVGTEGDSFFAVFARAADAVDAAVAAQRALADEEWPADASVKVRIGLHTGSASREGNDYVGLDVHRAARIMAAAHGGQIVMSEATRLALGQPPAGIDLRELGQHRLRDLSAPERLYQVSAAGLESTFPPLRTVDAIPNNLPAQTTELIGREAELEAIRALLDTPAARLITLVGPGGIGKTRLAVQAAADRIHAFEDGAYFADLAAATDVASMFDALVRALGVVVPADGVPGDAVADHLRSRSALLLLDNFEQLMDAAVQVTDILARCPRVKVLVTSRESLRLRGERVVAVPPLSLPEMSSSLTAAEAMESDAVRLFVSRADEALGGFTLADTDAAAIGEVCARLDGLPLAIELAAASLRLLSPATLRDRLTNQLEPIASGPRDLPDRQRTLRATIEWSHQLLDEDQQALFAVLSVFSTARVDAVQGVATSVELLSSMDALTTLSALVDKSLVRSQANGGDTRVVMLETIRRFAADKLAEREDLAEAARHAHAAYYTRFAADVRRPRHGGNHGASVDRLAAELDNLETAWRHHLEHNDVSELNRLVSAIWPLYEGRGWYHRLVALANDLLRVLQAERGGPEQADDEITLRLTLGRALLAIRGYTPEVERLYQEALDVSKAAAEAPRRLAVLRSLGSFYLYRAQVDRTAEVGQQLLELAAETGDPALELEGQMMVGPATAFLGDPRAGLRHLARAMELFDPDAHRAGPFRLGPSPGVAAPVVAALFHWWLGQPETAAALASRAIEMADRLDHPYSAAYAHFHVSVLDIWNGDHASAQRRADRVLEIAGVHDYRIWIALGQVVRGLCISALDDPQAGLQLTEAGVAMYEGIQTPPVFWPLLLSLKAQAYARAGRLDESLATLDHAVGLTGPRRNWLSAAFIAQKADVLRSAGRESEAVADLQRAADEARELGSRMILARALIGLCELTDGAARQEHLGRLGELMGELTEGDNDVIRRGRALIAG